MNENRRVPCDAPLLEAIPAGACVVESEKLRIRAHNRAFLAYLSPLRPEQGAVGRHLEEVLDEEARGAVSRARRSGEATFRRTVGHEDAAPACQVHVAPIRTDAAASPWYMVTFWEVTDRTSPELASACEPSVRAANERLAISALEAHTAAEREARARDEAQGRANETEAVFSAISDVLLVYDMDGRVLRGNQAARQVLGSDPVGKTWAELARAVHLRRTDGQAVADEILPVVRALAGDASSVESLLITAADGQERVVNPSAAPLELAPGQTGVVSVWRDVTERERLIQELRTKSEALKEADRNKDEFLAVLSHELRNPLTPIRNCLYVLERAVPGGEQARRSQQVMERQVSHLTRLVDDLLDLNRITRGKVQLQPERFVLGELVLRTAEDYRAHFASLGLKFQAKVTPAPLWLHADPIRVVQVIGNLLRNGAKFTHTGGEVELSLGDERGFAVISVRDTGSGIDADLLEQLFKPFMQADRTLARSGGGLGLGLALVKGLVELQGGSVSVRSDGPGRGAEFQVRFPLVPPPAESASLPAEPESLRRLRVLVVEDNSDAAESLLDALTFMGHHGEVAPNGRDALTLARRHLPDVVLCDIGLPGMDGYQVAQAFRADPVLRSCHLVALSGYAQPEDCLRAAESGFAAHIPKPPSLPALAELLSRAGVEGAAGA